MNKVIAVDFDRTLAYYESGDFQALGPFFFGGPIIEMVNQVKRWREDGAKVVVFTARLRRPSIRNWYFNWKMTRKLQDWTLRYIGAKLEITNIKDHTMSAFYDDRAYNVEPNKGIINV